MYALQRDKFRAPQVSHTRITVPAQLDAQTDQEEMCADVEA